MTITTREMVIGGIAALALIVAGIFYGNMVLKDHDAKTRAEATDASTKAAQAQADKAIADRDALLKQYQASIAQQEGNVKTAGQAVQVIEHYIPSPQQAVVVQKADLTPQEQAKLPDAPSYVVTTQQQAVDTAKTLLQCDATGKALDTCKADLDDTGTKLTAETQDAAVWRLAAKGGTKWQRFRAGLGHALCGGVGVGAGTITGQKSSQQTGLIVGGGTFVACELLQLR